MYEMYQKHELNSLSSRRFNSILFYSYAVLPLSRVTLFKRFVFRLAAGRDPIERKALRTAPSFKLMLLFLMRLTLSPVE